MNYEELKEFTFLHSHCSAIFKAKEDLTNVFMAHNSLVLLFNDESNFQRI